MKEEINNAKQFLQGQKDKYFENLRLSSQQSANQSQAQLKAQEEENARIRQEFNNGTQKFFGEGFEGFVFEGGENKKFRIKEQGNTLAQNQADVSKVLGKHFNDDGSVKDWGKWHKALYAFENVDKIFQHAYNQGQADAIKESAMSTKNIDMSPQTSNSQATQRKKASLDFTAVPPGFESNNY